MQRVRNNIHKARKHTQKARKDVRKIRLQWRKDCYKDDIPLETLRAMEETEQIISEWLKRHEEEEKWLSRKIENE